MIMGKIFDASRISRWRTAILRVSALFAMLSLMAYAGDNDSSVNSGNGRSVTIDKSERLADPADVKILRDPFSEGNLVASMPTSSGIAGITVTGILIPKDGLRMAALEIPGYRHSLLVRENDVLRLKIPADGGGKASRLVEIVVKRIKELEVEVVAKNAPNDIIVLR